MTIPDYQTIMLPFLQLLRDKREHSLPECIDKLVAHFNVTPEEFAIMIPSERQGLFYNRACWARTHLGKAGLLRIVRRGWYTITDEGAALLATKPEKITVKSLFRYAVYADFMKKMYGNRPLSKKNEMGTVFAHDESATPLEKLEQAHTEMKNALADDLLEKVKAAPPEFFEQLVLDLMFAMGYGGNRKDATQRLGRTGDGGVDGVIKEDQLGLDVIYIQAKRWDGNVGSKEIRNFKGALEEKRAKKGVFVTTSAYTQEALDCAKNTGVILIDGIRLAELMIENNVGVSLDRTFELKRIDNDYFEYE